MPRCEKVDRFSIRPRLAYTSCLHSSFSQRQDAESAGTTLPRRQRFITDVLKCKRIPWIVHAGIDAHRSLLAANECEFAFEPVDPMLLVYDRQLQLFYPRACGPTGDFTVGRSDRDVQSSRIRCADLASHGISSPLDVAVGYSSLRQAVSLHRSTLFMRLPGPPNKITSPVTIRNQPP
jgi:hypothetical protein